MSSLISKYGSFRLALQAYWTGQMSPEEERSIESDVPKDVIANFKPAIIGPKTLKLDSAEQVEEILKAVLIEIGGIGQFLQSEGNYFDLACLIVNESAKRQL